MSQRPVRAFAVAAAVAAPLLVWLLARVSGTAMLTLRSGAISPLEPLDLIAVSLVAGAAAWASLALLERLWPRRATVAWTTLASLAVLAVAAQTLTETELGPAQRLLLVARALALAVALIPPLAWTSARRERRT